ncbi:MAG: hypothetical protein U1E76_18040 [Planctomycetota bacterium]
MLALFTLLLGWLAPALTGTLVLMTLLGIASGIVVVPIESILQWRAPAGRRGAVIALSNVFACWRAARLDRHASAIPSPA